MAWTDKTYVAGDRLTTANMNLWVRDNFDALKRPQCTVNLVSKGANITTASTVAVVTDPVYFVVNLTPAISSGLCDIDVWMSFALRPSSGAAQIVYFRLDVNGAPSTVAGKPNMVVEGSSSIVFPVSYRFRLLDQPPGAKSINLAWWTSGGLTATIYANSADVRFQEGQFGACEV